MLLQAALVQVLFATLTENAMEAKANVFLSVDLYMLHEVWPTRKLFGAVLALEWLLSCMNSLMTDQVAGLAEGNLTAGVVTLIWLLLVVYSHVLLERG